MKLANLQDLYELSPVQQGFLFHSLNAPDSGVYLEQLTFTFCGALDISVFTRAWQTILDRHSSMRTVFYWEGLSKPLQAVQRHVPLSLEELDWRGFSADEQQARLAAFLLDDRRQGFDLSCSPLMRFTLVRFAEDEWRFLFRFHHLVTDGWAMGLILGEFMTLYKAFHRSREPVLPPCRPYRDYISWLKRQDPGKAESFWRAQLKGLKAPTVLTLGGDAESAPGNGSAYQTITHEKLDAQYPALAEQIQAMARRYQLTTNTVVQGGWSLLLSRLTGDEDVIAGVSVGGRPPDLPGSDSIVGLMINTLPVRTRVPRHAPVLQWLKEFQAQQVSLQQHGYVSLVQMGEWSEMPPGTPLFETLLVYENVPFPQLSLREDGLAVPETKYDGRPHYPISVIIFAGMTVRVTYERARYSEATILQILRHFELLLSAIVANPLLTVEELPLMATQERQLLLTDWNATAVDYRETDCLHTLFEKQVERTPDRPAVAFEEQQLTYRGLNEHANLLARHLKTLGVKAETPVAICMERSLEMVVAMLAVLKAGGAYLPLDPAYPRERLAYMLKESQAPVLLTRHDLLSCLPGDDGRFVNLDAVWEIIARQDASNLNEPVGPGNLAYVIYTSGSTGNPKGVMVSHKSICNRLLWGQQKYALKEDDRVLQKTPYSFDVSVWEFFWPLLNGAVLVMALPEGHRDPSYLARTIQESGITVLHFVPSMLRAFLAAEDARSCAGLKQIFCSGEALDIDLCRGLQAGTNAEIHNLYGPTEAAVEVSFWQYPSDWREKSLPIGKPVANTQLHVLDKSMEPVPVGLAGELYLGGVQLARGYLNRPELTAEIFVPNPFTSGGERLYRTGDMVRYRHDGNVEYLGRVDHQVKIRGFRIELAEIETVLGAHPGVRRCAVIAREDKSGEKRLVAYVVGAGLEALVSFDVLRDYLRTRLPEYMLPASYVPMEELPVLSNGKLDRNALPAPDHDSHGDSYVAPRTEEEEILAGMWAQLLGREQVGIHDNFFAIGGHSLLATQVISRVRATFKVELPLRAIFSTPTVEGLAESISQHLRAETIAAILPPLQSMPRTALVPASFAQERLWFLARLDSESRAYNVPSALALDGPLNAVVLERVLQEIVHRHGSLRTHFEEVNGVPMQVIGNEVRLILPMEDLSTLPVEQREERMRELIQRESEAAFDLGTGPLLRFLLLRLEEEKHVLCIVMHHIISDGWSLNVLRRELSALYDAYLKGEESPLPELPVQYADYSEWQRSWLRGDLLQQELGYWKARLGELPPVVDLPAVRPRPAVRSLHGDVLEIEFSPKLSRELQALSQREGVTLFMTVLAAWQALLHRYTGQKEICVGAPVAGRNQQEVEPLIGFFVNALVLKTSVSGGTTFRELLHRVRETVLQAHAHQELPFEKLVAELAVERSQSYTPLFQTVLGLRNNVTPWKLGEVEVSPVAVHTKTAKFDLLLQFALTPDGKLTGELEYSLDLFDAGTVRRIAGHLEQLLSAAVADVQQPVTRLPFLSAQERRQVVEEWNRTDAECPSQKCIHELFAEQAASTPESPALTFKDQCLTYRQLNERANQLARYLQKRGATVEVGVGVCMDRSLEMVTALLAILKAGAAFVPLEPNYPAERLRYMLKDSGIKLLVTQTHLRDRIPAHHCTVVCVDQEWPQISLESTQNLKTQTTPENLAYVMYTSGSTGKPKGVSVIHRNVVRLVKGSDFVAWNATDVFLQLAPISFDASTFEIWGSLLNGCRLAIYPPGVPELKELGRELREKKITVLWLTTGLFHQMVERELPSLAGVKQLLAGGDVLSPGDVNAALQAGCTVINGYGPTENTTFTCCFLMTGQQLPGSSVPIGRPIANTRVYVLDGEMQPVPVGVAGELYTGGMGMARGYLNRPDLTAEKFVPDPFSSDPGDRLYRTGDLVKWLEDGVIEFLGRADNQIKLRGFRVELGEIESILLQHEEVKQAVAITREDVPGEKRLVAYMVMKEDGQEKREESSRWLRGYLQEKLPEYMVPSAFVAMAEFPLSPNGKVDRQALPQPEIRADEETYVAPRTPTEEILCGIWAQLLGAERVGVHDSFFELGGHSLLATQMISRMREAFKIELPLRSIFSAPTPAGLAESIEQRLRAQAPAESLLLLRRVARKGPVPASYAQERLWFLAQLEGDSPTYNVPGALRLCGPLNTKALKRALQEIVDRHEVLRTRFEAVNGVPMQVVARELPFPLTVEDLSSLDPQEREQRARQLIQEESTTAFNLRTGPLMRGRILRLNEEEHILCLVVHHIVSDGWSVGVLGRELSLLYAAFLKAEPSPLPELPVQYADYAAWQRERLQGELLQKELGYWREKLSGAPPVLELPSDRPRPLVLSERGDVVEVEFSKELCSRLRALSEREGATLFMTLLAAWQLLLHRYTGETDISVGTPVAGRKHLETEGLIGFFVNTLVIRTDLSGEPTFRELLRRVRDVVLEAHAHQELPFEKLVAELFMRRSQSYSPLFQNMLAFMDKPRPWNLEGLETSMIAARTGTSKFDLLLQLGTNAEGKLHGDLEYSQDLFDSSTVRRMVANLESLLEAIVADPGQPIAFLNLLPAEQRCQVVKSWNQTETSLPRNKCVHELFEEQAERTPNAPAVAYEGEQLNYRELNERANHLAHHLRSLGVGPDLTVAIALDRSIRMVISLLATLKAGGAYLPLDTDYPPDRLEFMLNDARPIALITQRSFGDLFLSYGGRIVYVDADWLRIAQQPAKNPFPLAQPGNLAYVIFTSGSTGKPKGVSNEHHGIVNRLLWTRETFKIGSEGRVAQKTPYTFDVSVWEFFWPLISGACLVVAKPGGHRDPEYLVQFIIRQKITNIHFVPSMLQAFLEAHGVEECTTLRRVFCSGEALTAEVQDRFFERMTAELHNLYGPTEAAVDVTWWACRLGIDSVVPIGKPIANVQLYVLDTQFQPVPVRVPGELHIGGVQVARGYLNRPELTAERFIPHPFSAEPGARLYRTGDLARWREDGAIEFLGRMDHQVKLRGNRIELGEIESVLRQHKAVKQAVAITREDVPGDKRLVAYVEAKEKTEELGKLLKAFLQDKLPEHMVPSLFVQMEALPLTSSGKVDRKALPLPEGAVDAEKYVGPQTQEEEILCGIWGEVLRLPRVGVHDNFFEIGGHSLIATQIISRVRAAFKVELPLRAIFACPTIARLAENIVQQLRAGVETLPAMQRTPRDGPVPASFAQERLWFLAQLDGDSRAYNMPGALRLLGPLNAAVLQRAVQQIVNRHEVLRTRFETVDGLPMQVITDFVQIPLPMDDLSALDENQREERAAELIRQEAERKFDLEEGPLFRLRLLKLGAEEHILGLMMHHIISDGWSLNVLRRELALLYEAFLKGEEPPLPDLAIQYADYSQWQRDWLRGGILERQLTYWSEKLRGASPVLELRADRPRQPVRSLRGGMVEVELSPELSQQLQDISQREGVTLFMTLMAAWQVLIYRYSDETDISVGTPVAGRNHKETEGLIGFFVNTLVLRTSLSGDPTFGELLQRVREVVLEAYAHQDLPFEKLVAELSVERSLSYTPLFQTVLTFQDMVRPWKLDQMEVSPIPALSGAAKFDLLLQLQAEEVRIRGLLEYSLDLFDSSTVCRMMDHLKVLLEAAVADVQQPISRLSLLTVDQEQQVLGKWSHIKRAYAPEKCLHELFEEQVERTPDAPALAYEGRCLKYAELNVQVNQLAHHLRSRGVGPGMFVAIAMERGIEMVVCLLATLKAGAAYVPLPPEYPSVRLRFMLEDVKPAVVLTQRSLAARLSLSSAHTICVDDERSLIAQSPGTNPVRLAQPHNTAYVVYTSGSTGKPKGVLVSHFNVVRLFQATEKYYQFNSSDCWTLFHSYAFDFSVWELWGALAYGGKLVVVSYLVSRSVSELYELVKTEKVSVLNQTPSAWDQFMLEDEERRESLNLRYVIFGGETLVPRRLSSWFARHGERKPRLVNMYGITETTVHVTLHELQQKDAEQSTSLVGSPIEDLQVYVLDKWMKPMPVGVAGELYVGGAGLAHGYLNRPELTAARFVPHPFGSEPGARLYRTGDLARQRETGSIEFLGRIDQQVKIRGYRVELGEIESMLQQHEAVRQAIVIVRQDEPGQKQLVAYVTGKQETEGLGRQLRSYLQERLPDYMVPAALVQLDELPLTSNGKVDRKTLPQPDQTSHDKNLYLPPRDRFELQLAQTWEELLRVQPIGVRESFFEIGGHSLLALRLITRIRKQFGYDLPLAELFRSPSIESLAMVLRRKYDSRPESSLVALQAKGKNRPLFFVHPVGGHVLCYMDLARSLGEAQPFYAFQSAGFSATPRLHRSVEDMAAYYLRELKAVHPQGPHFLGGWSFGGVVAFEMAQQLNSEGQKVSALVLMDCAAPLPSFQPADLEDSARMAHFASILGGQFGKDLCLSAQELQAIAPEKRLDRVLEKAKNADVLPLDIETTELRRLYDNVFGPNLQALLNYRPRPYPDRIILLRAGEQIHAEDPLQALDLTLGWNELAPGRVDVHKFPGNHFTLVREPNVQAVSACLKASLQRALEVDDLVAKNAVP
ncbi:MAG TPA: non-ribosomal peptide synthase/polyketide synthase [Candidatus Angelobacter sp.]|jgi:amino acid adenylation domain-containing protein